MTAPYVVRRWIVTASMLGAGVAQGQEAPGAGWGLGTLGAETTVVAFTDFGCPACAQFAVTTFPALRAEFIEAGSVRWELVPVALGFRH